MEKFGSLEKSGYIFLAFLEGGIYGVIEMDAHFHDMPVGDYLKRAARMRSAYFPASEEDPRIDIRTAAGERPGEEELAAILSGSKMPPLKMMTAVPIEYSKAEDLEAMRMEAHVRGETEEQFLQRAAGLAIVVQNVGRAGYGVWITDSETFVEQEVIF